MNAKRIGSDIACIIGCGLAGTSIGFHIAGDIGAAIGATGGTIVGFAVSTWSKIPR